MPTSAWAVAKRRESGRKRAASQRRDVALGGGRSDEELGEQTQCVWAPMKLALALLERGWRKCPEPTRIYGERRGVHRRPALSHGLAHWAQDRNTGFVSHSGAVESRAAFLRSIPPSWLRWALSDPAWSGISFSRS